ncbi:CGNR zinc finger domain-containing protein [Parafrankia sp. FMc2]|uniref:CGNR zinc finger domain-containing protein n=1 Tax=Parafrankia sp. FMc2 TaxID=3233196 RepID=UPI0034D5D5C9
MKGAATAVRVLPPGELPDWELQFRFLSGRLCLAYTATVGERWRRSFERLRTGEDLGRWFVAADLLTEPPTVTEAQLRSARRLREAVYRTARAAIDGGAAGDGDLRLINTHARHAGLAPQLTGLGTQQLHPGRTPVEAALATVSRDAVELLGSPDVARIRECASDECALLFFDASRPGRRRWCSDQACGNRARAAHHRARRS